MNDSLCSTMKKRVWLSHVQTWDYCSQYRIFLGKTRANNVRLNKINNFGHRLFFRISLSFRGTIWRRQKKSENFQSLRSVPLKPSTISKSTQWLSYSARQAVHFRLLYLRKIFKIDWDRQKTKVALLIGFFIVERKRKGKKFFVPLWTSWGLEPGMRFWALQRGSKIFATFDQLLFFIVERTWFSLFFPKLEFLLDLSHFWIFWHKRESWAAWRAEHLHHWTFSEISLNFGAPTHAKSEKFRFLIPLPWCSS